MKIINARPIEIKFIDVCSIAVIALAFFIGMSYGTYTTKDKLMTSENYLFKTMTALDQKQRIKLDRNIEGAKAGIRLALNRGM